MLNRGFLRWLVAVAALSAGMVAPAAAVAAQRMETIALPSTQGNVDPANALLNGVTSLQANVLLPDGYDEHPERTYPILYLLHGGADNFGGWAATGGGDVTRTAAGFPGIIVMPEAGRGSFIDWWTGGTRQGPRWTRYYLDEVFPTIESRYRVTPGRQNHAIGGLSMGAYGAMFLGGQLPGYFGTILSFSAVLDQQTPVNAVVSAGALGQPFENMVGPVGGPYATAHNPMRTMANVASSRVYIYSGNGVPSLAFPYDQNAWTIGAAAEAATHLDALQYASRSLFSGMNVTTRLRIGVHAWPYWRRELGNAIAWGIFGRPPVENSAAARRWKYQTMEPAGNAWNIGYRFAAPTTSIFTLTRDDQRVVGTGNGTVTISPAAADADATGAGSRPDCSFTTTLPFERTLPAGC